MILKRTLVALLALSFLFSVTYLVAVKLIPSEPTPEWKITPEYEATLSMVSAHAPLQEPEVLDADSRSNRTALDTMMRKSLAGQASPPPFTPPLQVFNSEIVGTLEGRFSVDNKGAGEYSIALPDRGGRGEPSPSLSLSYSSRVSNSNAGFRFYVTDGYYNMITRGRNFLARDGEARGIELTRKDRFYLDGKRLLCVSDPELDGLPGCVYRTEVDSFVEIEAVGSDDTIEGFVLRNKSGYTYYFGKYGDTNDAAQRGVLAADKETLSDVICEFALKRVENSFGYYMTFTYEQLAPGNWDLRYIDYTGTPEQEPGNRIEYIYRESSSTAEYYKAMTVSKGRFVIDEIKVSNLPAEKPVARYDLVYEQNENDGVLRLKELRPYFASYVGGTLQSMSPTRFYWSKGFDPDGDFELQPIPKSASQMKPLTLGDFNGDGKSDLLTVDDELHVALSSNKGLSRGKPYSWGSLNELSKNQQPKAQPIQIYGGEFNGDNLDDLLLVHGDSSVQALKSNGNSFSPLASINLEDLPQPPLEVLPGDLNGDGRDDILVRSSTNELQAYLYQNDGFTNTPTIHSLGSSLNSRVQDVRGASMDLNGDGLDDYIWLELTKTANDGLQDLTLKYCIGESGKNFSIPVQLKKWSDIDSPDLDDMDALSQEVGVLIGDYNADDRPDFALGTVRGDNCEWDIIINKCQPTSLLTPNQEQVAILSSVASSFTLPHLPPTPKAAASKKNKQSRFQINGRNLEVTTANGPQILDTNRDGIDDIVFQGQTSKSKSRALTLFEKRSKGNGTFQDKEPLHQKLWQNILNTRFKSNIGTYAKLDASHDTNGDGLSDLLLLETDRSGNARIRAIVDGVDRSDVSGPLRNMMVALVEGGGRTVCVSYRASKDDRAYTPGPAVDYPIREIRSSGPVVTEVWKDEGSGNFAQYGYQYTGRRSDFSGRGSLGFSAFTTIDRYTGFLSYQHLIQSYPTTGLTLREEVYRTWEDRGSFRVKVVGVEDYASLYDAVTSLENKTYYGTVFPFKSQLIETDWQNDLNFHYTINSDRLDDWSGAALFIPDEFPSDSSYTRVQNFWHDDQNLNITPPTKFQEISYPYILAPQARPKKTMLPGLIHYGNQTLDKLDYGFGLFEQTSTNYYPPSQSHPLLVSLKQRVEKSSNLDAVSDKIEAPEDYEYVPGSNYLAGEWRFNSLSTESKDEEDTYFQYPRDSLGRQTVSYRTVLDENFQLMDESVETRYQASDFDPITDEPQSVTYSDGEERTYTYNPVFNKPKQAYYDRGITVFTKFDGLGRKISVTNPSYEYEKTVSFHWTHSGAQGWLSRQTILPPKGSNGVINRSVYVEITSESNEPTKLNYYDRVGRLMRTVEIQEDKTQTITDTVFDSRGREAAVSEPYTLDSTIEWLINHYDVYGVVSHTSEFTQKSIEKR